MTEPQFILDLRACEHVLSVTYMPTSKRVIVTFPRERGGRSSMTVPAAKALLTRLQSRV